MSSSTNTEAIYQTDASRWRAIQTRDQAATPFFVYAVISTKIYCRPACPSRIARRANVCFYDTAKEAETAGFRPCLRCKPNQPMFSTDSQHAQRDAVRRAREYIKETSGQAKFPEVAKHVGLSTRYLYGIFKTVMGTTPAKYAASLKSNNQEQTPSIKPSLVSSATSPTLGELPEPMVDSINWNALTDPDYLHFAELHRATEPSLQYNDVCTGSLLVPSMSDYCLVVDDERHFIPLEQYYTLPTNPAPYDPITELFRW